MIFFLGNFLGRGTGAWDADLGVGSLNNHVEIHTNFPNVIFSGFGG